MDTSRVIVGNLVLGAIVALLLAVAAPSSSAEDDPVPPPTAPDVRVEEDIVPIEAEWVGAPIEQEVPVEYVEMPAAPNVQADPCADPCPLECGQIYDACGWPLWGPRERPDCLVPHGRFELSLEGLVGLTCPPEGTLGPATGLPNQMEWDAIECKVAFGGRVGLQVAASPRDRFLLRGAWYGSWESDVRQTGVVGFRTIPSGPVLATLSNTATTVCEVEMYGGEAHWWHEMGSTQCWRFDLGLGLRYLHLEETATVDTWSRPFPGFNGRPYLQGVSANDFLGGQIGAAIHFDATRKLEIYASAKGLVGALDRDLQVEDRSIFVGGTHSASEDETLFSWGVDAEIGLRLRVSQGLLLTVGYQFLLMDGIVRGVEMFDFNQGATGAVQVQVDESMRMFHQVFAGLTFNF